MIYSFKIQPPIPTELLCLSLSHVWVMRVYMYCWDVLMLLHPTVLLGLWYILKKCIFPKVVLLRFTHWTRVVQKSLLMGSREQSKGVCRKVLVLLKIFSSARQATRWKYGWNKKIVSEAADNTQSWILLNLSLIFSVFELFLAGSVSFEDWNMSDCCSEE